MFKSSTQLNLMPKENDLLIHPIFQSSPPYATSKSTFEVSQVVPQGNSSSNVSKISPIVLLMIIILAGFIFILGFLHLLFRYLSKRPPSRSLFIHSNRYNITTDQSSTTSSHVLQRQLQQLFRLHDSGLDQSSIDNLPVFHYKDVVMGLMSKSKQQFDCAVCLSEFSNQDKLKLLPICSHAFHINCIDPWLMSNSTCPLCRCTLLNPTSLSSLTQLTTSHDYSIALSSLSTDSTSTSTSTSNSNSSPATLDEKRVYSIRLGKFKTLTNDEDDGDGDGDGVGDGEISSSGKLDGRRCYSMGSYQYVVTHDTYLKFKGVGVDGDCVSKDGKKIGRNSLNGDSFSVSKIWLWSKKKKYEDHHHHELKVGEHGGVIVGLDIV